MSLAELKSEVEKLPIAERQYLAAYLKHLTRRQDPDYGRGLDATWEAMQRGEKISLEPAWHLSNELRKSSA
jgi:hypothetical protein